MQAAKRFMRGLMRPTWLVWVLALACLMSSDGQRTLGRSLETIISGLQKTLNGFAHASHHQYPEIKTVLLPKPTQAETDTSPLLERFAWVAALVVAALLLVFLAEGLGRGLVFFGFARAPPLLTWCV